MADDGILGLLGRMNDPQALYGGALSDPATRQAMAGHGLLAMAGSFADSAMPTRMPTPFGAVLGHAAAAGGASEDAIMESRLRNAQAQQAMANVGLLNQMGPAYQQFFEAAKKEQERLAALAAGGAPGGGIPITPPPGTGTGTGAGKPPTGPINPELVTWEAKNQGINPLIAHTTADIESSYGANTGNKISPSNTGVFQRARADEPGGQNDTHANQIRLGVQDLVQERNGLRNVLGREPTNAEVYLAHQQGVSGATKLINNPNTPAGELVPPINISNNAGDPKASAGAFVQHWEQAYNKREAKFAALAAPVPPGGGLAAGLPPPPGGAVRGLLDMPNLTGQMNAPIPGIAGGVAPAAPSLAPPATPPGAAAAAGPPRSAGEMLVAANQATSAAGGLPRLPPSLVQTADASGQVPLPAGGLVPGGRGLLGAGAPPIAPPGAAPPPPPPQAPVPPIAMPQAAPAPAAPPTGGPPGAPPPLNLPPPPTTMPSMPAGGMPPPVQATPLQMIAQGIVGLSSLTGHPAPDFMQKIAGQPIEMQMEAYKAYVGAQANQMTAQYQKQLDASAAQYIAYQTSMGNLPAEKEKQTHEQDLKLRNDMRLNLGLVLGSDGHYHIDPAWLDAKAQAAGVEAQAKAQYDLKEVTVTDPVTGQQRKQQMTAAQAAEYYRTQGGGPGAPGAGAGPGAGTGIPGAPGAAAPGTPPGIPGQPIYTPGGETEQKARGEVLGGEYKGVVANSIKADAAKPYLLAIEQALQAHNTTGPGDETRLAAWKAVQSAAQTAGIAIPAGLQDWIAKGEIIGKGGTHLGFELANSLGSQEASNIVQQAVKNNPGLGTSPQGNQELLALLNSIGDRAGQQRTFYDAYFKKNNTYDGAQTAFNQANPWEVTMSQFAPYQADKLGRDDASAKAAYDKLPTGVKVQTPKIWWIKPPPGQAIVTHPVGGP